MSNRRERGSPISLFFFQDIITCVSGVMILLMLLFALSVPEEVSSEPESSSSSAKPKDLSIEIQQLQNQLSELRRNESAYAYAHDITKLKDKTKATAKDSSRKKTEIKRLLREIAAAEGAVQQAKQQLETAKGALARARNTRNIRFIPEDQTSKTLILVQCSAKTFLCGVAGSGLEPVRFASKSLAPCLRHIKGFDTESSSFVFLLKPSSIESAFTLINIVRAAGFSVGYDALEEDSNIDF